MWDIGIVVSPYGIGGGARLLISHHNDTHRRRELMATTFTRRDLAQLGSLAGLAGLATGLAAAVVRFRLGVAS